MAKILYQGHASLRITTDEGKIIYIDPYVGGGYDLSADLILITHQHGDHNNLDLIKSKNMDCNIITEKEALKEGEYQKFDYGYVTVEATKASNKNHDPDNCVGYIITLSGNKQIYVSGDTSKIETMEGLARRKLDYAFICCDGVYNMGIEEASECASLIAAKHTIPYHMSPGELFNRQKAELFQTNGLLIIADNETFEV